MKRTATVLVALLVTVVAGLAPSVARAGGWAVASLDPLPAVQAGAPSEVGFRLLQHGMTPVVAADWSGATVGLAVRAGGDEWFVPATAAGDPGHYVAVVDVPADVATIAVDVQMRNGLFVDEAWADVAVQRGGASNGSDGWMPTWTVPLFALLAAACLVALLGGGRSTRRRGDAPGAAPA